MDQRISPVSRLSGSVSLPGDKSISHRYAMLTGIAEGTSVIENYATGADCQSTLGCMRDLGVEWTKEANRVTVQGRGLHGLMPPSAQLDAGNSGSTIRMLSGILAAQPFRASIGGDDSLSKRPMARILNPLREMGARIEAREGSYPPLTIDGAKLQAIDYALPVPSAQVKSCVLLAGLYAEGTTIVREPIKTRDHTEIALAEFGAEITVRKGEISISGGHPLKAQNLLVPGDLSSAAFFLVAGSILPNSEIVIRNVGLNPSRTALLDFLAQAGARVRVLDVQGGGGEIIGHLQVSSANVQGGTIEGALTAALIDEIPALSVFGALSRDGLTVRDAGELRVKETDRIATICANLRLMGVDVEEAQDGFRVPGRQKLRAATLDSHGDHRIAMAFAVAALASDGDCVIREAEAASVSFPEFYDTLRTLAA